VEVVGAKAAAGATTPGAASSAAPSGAGAAQGDGAELRALLPLRRELGAAPVASWRLTETLGFWAGLLGGPALVLGAAGGGRLLRLLARRARERGLSATKMLERELGAATRAAAQGAWDEVAAHLERALYVAIESGCGLKARAVLRGELATRIVEQGGDEASAREAVAVLDELEELRFAQALDEARVGELVPRATRASRALLRASPPREANARRSGGAGGGGRAEPPTETREAQ